MSRFARERRVFFFEEPVFEGAASPQLKRSVCDKSGVTVLTPSLPSEMTPEQITECQEALLDGFLEAERVERYVAWYYTPMAREFTRHLRPVATVYDCMDELSAFAGAPPAMKRNEADLFAHADLVFTGGARLYESKRDQHPSVHLFPSSVDVAHFGKARRIVQEPVDQAGIPGPKLGYAGVIDERMDVKLLGEVAARRPDWHFVMIGPVVKIDPATLPDAPNIHYLGMKPYSELPAYFSGWKIGMLPFALNESTKFISPTKTPEYLAAGLRVISTPIRDVVTPYGDMGLAAIAGDGSEFVSLGEQLLHSASVGVFAQRADAFLAGSSWDGTWSEMNELINAAGRKVPRPRRESRRIAPGREHVFDYLVVGAGFAGAVAAERLARVHRKKVMVVDRRSHIGGNAYDHYNDDGLLVHRYGPHIFHTNSEQVFDYLSQFTQWRNYEHRVLASVDKKLVPIPINLDTVNKLYGLNLTSTELEQFFARIAEPRPSIRTSEDVVVSRVGRDLYEKMFRNYTRKQWGKDPSELDAQVTARIPFRTNHDDRYFTDRFQFMPKHGYTRMFENMLDHRNISVTLGCDFRDVMKEIDYDELIFSGPVDEYFDYRYGNLPYRSLRFEHETVDREYAQPVAVINYPNEHQYTRVTEFKHLTGQVHPMTSVVYEYPCGSGDPYYPVPTAENAALYKKYAALAEATPKVHFTGRLGTYKYYNMDQVVAQSLTLCKQLASAPKFVAAKAQPAKVISVPLPAVSY